MTGTIRHVLLLLIVCGFTAISIAQSTKIDSLKNTLPGLKDDTTKITVLNNLTDEIWQKGDYEKSFLYAQQSRQLAEKINFRSGQATALINISLIFWKQGDYPKALEHAFKALKINEEIENKKGISRALNAIGLIYYNQKFYSQALERYYSSLKIREETGDQKGVAGSLNNIGEVYISQGNYSGALEQYFKALKINEQTGNKNWKATNINNIGNIYYALGKKSGPQAQNLKINNDNFIKASHYYTEALDIRKEIGDKQGICLSSISLGLINIHLHKYIDAKIYFEDALSLSKKIGYREAVKEGYRGLSLLDSATGQWQDAFQHHKQYIVYRDSLLNEENTKKSVRTEMNFNFNKKEQAIQLEQEKKDMITLEEKKKQKIITLSVSVGLVFALVLAIVILRSLRQNQRKNKIITAQKELVETQKKIVEEKQKEITDSINYAERIQRSFLATEALLKKNLSNYFVFFQPKDIVSGDFYWAAELSNGQFSLVTADSTGHGVPGAIMSILNISCLEKSVEEKQLLQPSEILDYTRTKIIERLKKDGSPEGGKDGMDCSVISFDFKNLRMTYAAANNPVWVVRTPDRTAAALPGNESELLMIELAPDKMPVGKHDKDSIGFSQHVAELRTGDMIYTLTDGYPDQFGGPKGKKFMYKQLKNLILSIAHLPMAEQHRQLNDSFKTWKNNFEQVDDVCIIGVRI